MELESFYEQNGIRYILVGDYYYPDLLPERDEETEALQLMVQQMAARMGVNEALKERDPMRWVGLMNNLKHAAMEIWNEE